MKGGLYIAAAAILGALLANLLLADSGYVALRFAGRLIEMSAVTFLLLLVALYFVGPARDAARSAHGNSGDATRSSAVCERARRSLGQGLLELSEGEYEAAEKTLTRYARDAENPVAHYLVAARAADLQGAAQRRDELLSRALEASTDRRAPVLIMQAEIHLKHKQLASALATLEQLEASGESNARGLLLLSRVHRQTGAWQRLLEIEPRLRSTRGIPPAVADETVAQIYLDRLKAAGAAADPLSWIRRGKTCRSRSRAAPTSSSRMRAAAMACDDQESAEAVLRESIERAWDESTVLTYGEVETDEPFEVLERAESWLPEHPEDPALLLTCARLAARAELYGKARTYLETSICDPPASRGLPAARQPDGTTRRARAGAQGAERCAGLRRRSQGEAAEDPHASLAGSPAR